MRFLACFIFGIVSGSLNFHSKQGLVAEGANFTLDGEPISFGF
ncbi:unnamed protein product [Oikopleura dioica]|uniref:Uncharacterized protein n=1 Tax=Oikopleura dioica TaxID=34765 RepID=E4XW23_OIKDI|nr:unnamed protein product [Oikopleura dioica]CBY33413.1 unnamed protein product [Oikopleura dioica]